MSRVMWLNHYALPNEIKGQKLVVHKMQIASFIVHETVPRRGGGSRGRGRRQYMSTDAGMIAHRVMKLAQAATPTSGVGKYSHDSGLVATMVFGSRRTGVV